MFPPLKALHARLHPDKLAMLERSTNSELIASLRVGERGSLKVRPDGTILDGHHRIHLLRERGVNVDELEREIIEKDLLAD